MSNIRHTPGPWKQHLVDNLAVIAIDGGPDICGVYGDDGINSEEMEANARLIAAAPDLLAALKALLFNATHGNGLDAHYRAQDEARAAIAKAEATE